MWKYLLAGVALLIVCCGANTLQAQTMFCAPHDTVVERLATKYGETKENAGLMNDNLALEIYSNQETGSWTVLSVNPEGTACLVAAGTIWLTFEPEPKGDPT